MSEQTKQFDWGAPWLSGVSVVKVGEIRRLSNGEPGIEDWTFYADDTAPPLSANDLKRMVDETNEMDEKIRRARMAMDMCKEEPMNRIYVAKVYCANCGYRATIDIPRGKQIREAECSRCGCFTLHRTELA